MKFDKELARKEAVKATTKAALLVSGLGCFFISEHQASYVPVFNLMAMGWIYVVLKGNVKNF